MAQLTLIVPGLLVPRSERSGAESRCPGLAVLLARATRTDGSPPYETLVCRLFGVRENPESDLPVAAITHRADFNSGHEGGWMRADPVHLRPDLGKLILYDGRGFSLGIGEARRLIREVNAGLEAHGVEITLGRDPKRWYLRLDAVPAVKTWPPSAVTTERLEGFLPRGRDAVRWVRLMNEAQMLLHDTEVNRERQGRGEPVINSLWFWGAGSVPAVSAVPGRAVWSSEPLMTGLGILGGCLPADLPVSLRALLEQARSATEYLVVFPEQADGPEAWFEQLARLDRDWFRPLLARLRLGRLRRVDLYTDGCHFELSMKSLWRVWRRPRRITPYIRG